MKQAHLFVSGTVQGVGYRQFVKSHARKRGLVGWVKNRSDGRVEAVVQGEIKSIKKLIQECEKGPFLAEVTNIVVDWEESKEKFSEFGILHE